MEGMASWQPTVRPVPTLAAAAAVQTVRVVLFPLGATLPSARGSLFPSCGGHPVQIITHLIIDRRIGETEKRDPRAQISAIHHSIGRGNHRRHYPQVATRQGGFPPAFWQNGGCEMIEHKIHGITSRDINIRVNMHEWLYYLCLIQGPGQPLSSTA